MQRNSSERNIELVELLLEHFKWRLDDRVDSVIVTENSLREGSPIEIIGTYTRCIHQEDPVFIEFINSHNGNKMKILQEPFGVENDYYSTIFKGELVFDTFTSQSRKNVAIEDYWGARRTILPFPDYDGEEILHEELGLPKYSIFEEKVQYLPSRFDYATGTSSVHLDLLCAQVCATVLEQILAVRLIRK
jgi:hypothetical protein